MPLPRVKPYDCFVTPDTWLPFMAMPDAIRALLLLATAPAERLHRTAYNVTAFSVSAATIAELVAELFPGAQIQFRPDPPPSGDRGHLACRH
jgi:threonine 3-dehydrogenase